MPYNPPPPTIDQILRELQQRYGDRWPQQALDELCRLSEEANRRPVFEEQRQRLDLLRAWCEETMRYGVVLRRALAEMPPP
jgi:hypothetical protein